MSSKPVHRIHAHLMECKSCYQIDHFASCSITGSWLYREDDNLIKTFTNMQFNATVSLCKVSLIKSALHFSFELQEMCFFSFLQTLLGKTFNEFTLSKFYISKQYEHFALIAQGFLQMIEK